MPAGRPSSYTEEIQELADQYVNDWFVSTLDQRFEMSNVKKLTDNDVIPTVQGLGIHIGVPTRTIYEWCSEDAEGNVRHPEMSHTLERLKEMQAHMLIQGGLRGTLNPQITKLTLSANHGINEKSEHEHTGAGGGPIQNETTRIEFVRPTPDSDT